MIDKISILDDHNSKGGYISSERFHWIGLVMRLNTKGMYTRKSKDRDGGNAIDDIRDLH